jgi:hypothetical protein
VERVYLTRLNERGNDYPFAAYLVSDGPSAWIELENEAQSGTLYVGLLDLANDHVPRDVLRVLAGHERAPRDWVVCGLPVSDVEQARLRYLVAHQGCPPHRATKPARRSPLAA